MKATKAQMVEFIYDNFTDNGNKIPKELLNKLTSTDLKTIIEQNNLNIKFEQFVDNPNLIEFMVDGIENGEEYSWDCRCTSKELCVAMFENRGVKVLRVAPKKGNHRCKYCNCIAYGIMEDLLCDECRMDFGHTFYSEL